MVYYIYVYTARLVCNFLPQVHSLSQHLVISHLLYRSPTPLSFLNLSYYLNLHRSYYGMASMTCTAIGPDCPADGSSLGYAPNVVASIVFLCLFSISLAGHVALGWKYKTWTFLIAMALGSSSELVGYLGRILMHNNPYKLSTLVSALSNPRSAANLSRFLVQIVCLTVGPAFYSAGLYLCLSRM